MPWQNELREAAYNSASGKRARFDFVDVGLSVDKETSAFKFPALKGTYVQDLGPSGRKYPLRCYFSGDNHNKLADEFLAMLEETGPGVLEHPFYGVVNVVPFGTIERQDALTTAANQTIFDVTFWATLLINFPTNQIDPAQAVLNSVSKFNTAVALQYAEQAKIVTVLERIGLRDKFRGILQASRSAMAAVTTPRDEIAREFNGVFDSVNRTLDLFASNPLDVGGLSVLASQATIFMQLPAGAVHNDTGARTNGREQINAYGTLVSSVIDDPDSQYTDNETTAPINNFSTDDLFVLDAVTGMVLSLVNATFDTKPQAISAADDLLGVVDSVIAWRDANFEALGLVDIGDAYQQFLDLISLLAGFLVQISFSLKQEYTLVLDRDRTLIDLVGELYGAVDEFLDFFISTNDLTGDEILELPRGRKIVYYR